MTPQLDHLLTIARRLGGDELAVLTMIAERLVTGREQYGSLNLASDQRDFRKEALEEAADGLVYAACGLIKGRCKRGA